MADFQPQTGQLILQAAQTIIQTENQRQQLELEKERQDRLTQQAKAEQQSKDREIAARERFASIQEQQLQFQQKATEANVQLKQAQAREAQASAALKQVQAAGGGTEAGLAEVTAGSRLNVAKEATRIMAARALSGSGNPAVSQFQGAPRSTIEAELRVAQKEREQLLANPTLQLRSNEARRVQLEEQINQRVNGAREALRIYDFSTTEVPPPDVLAETAGRLGLSVVTTDLLMTQQDRFPVMHQRHFGQFPISTVRRALSSVASGDTGPFTVMLDRSILREDGTTDTAGLKEVLEFLNGFGVRKETLDTIKQRYVGR
jgi:hypothetical protein